MAEIEGLEELAERLTRLADQVAYISVQDRTNHRHPESIGRFDFTNEQIRTYVAVETSTFGYTVAPPEEEYSPSHMAEVALRWVRECIEGNSTGEAIGRFRVRVYHPKGSKLLLSRTLILRNADLLEDYNDLSEGLSVDLDSAAHQTSVKGVVDLGNLYARFAGIVLTTFAGMQKVNNDFVDRQGEQLRDSSENVNALIAALFEHKTRQLELENQATVEERVAAGRTAVAKQAVETIGQAAEALMISKGISPDATKIVKVLGDNPDLANAMQDPDIQQMLQDPAVVAQVVELLKLTATQIKQQKLQQQAAESETPPTTQTPPPAP